MTADLSIDVVDLSDHVLITVAGEIDLYTSMKLTRALRVLLERRPPPPLIRADLGAVTFMDTIGIGVLLNARSHATAIGSGLVVVSLSRVLERTFKVAGVDRILKA